ncbi:MAG TPA: FHA domain-containing protein [Cellulomonas sp.]
MTDDVPTTHAGYGEGDPRLVLAMDDQAWAGEPQPVFPLDHEVTTIGSAPDADISLAGLAPRHARVTHDERDEYVLELLAPGEAPGAAADDDPTAPPEPQILRTGSTFRMGPWALSFERAERADHGRPHGGREGGEGSVQRFQSPQPDYTADHDEAARREARER